MRNPPRALGVLVLAPALFAACSGSGGGGSGGIARLPSDLSEGDYLVWDTDAPEDFTYSTEVPPPFQLRLRRTWAYTLTGDFSDARVFQGRPRFDEAAQMIEFNSVELGPERYFTLAVKPL